MPSTKNYNNLRDFARFHYYGLRYRTRGRVASFAQGSKGREELVRAFNSRNIILTVAAGRCGTDALTHRIGLLPGVTAVHEPLPHYRFILRKANHDVGLAARFFAHVKVPALLSYETNTVAESNHLYGKGFFEASVAMGFSPKLVFLRRDARANALSLLGKNCIPGRTSAGRRYVIAPSDNPYFPLCGTEQLSDFQLCYWYCLEMHLRDELYQQFCRATELQYVGLDTDDLNNSERLKSMARAINLAGPKTDLSVFDGPQVTKVVNAIAKDKLLVPHFDVDKEIVQLYENLGKPASIDEVYRRIAIIKWQLGK